MGGTVSECTVECRLWVLGRAKVISVVDLGVFGEVTQSWP